MTFEVVRILLILVGVSTESDIDDYKVVIYHTDHEHNINLSKTMKYGEIPDCFNCKVHAVEFDIDNKKIWIKSEVDNHE